MRMFAIAGGAGPGDEEVLYCCGMFPILPLVVLLVVVAVYRNSVRAALGALLLAGLPYLLMRLMVANYQPSDDGDVVADQTVGRRAVGFYLCMVAIAGLSVSVVAVRRLIRWGRSQADNGRSDVSQQKDYSLEGEDREEWDRLWGAQTQRLLPGECKSNLDLGHDVSTLKLAALTIAEDPPKFADRLWRSSEICPVCGESTVGRVRVATTVHVTVENGPAFGMGTWAHRACFESCLDTGIPAGIPW